MERSRTWVTPLIIFVIALIVSIFLIFLYSNDYLYFVYLFIAYYCFQSLMTITIFTSTRPDVSKQSWLVISLILPVVGSLLYFIFGRRYKYRKSNEVYFQTNDWWRSNQVPSNNLPSNLDTDVQKKFTFLANISHRNWHNSEIDFHFSGEDAYEKLFKALKNAKKSIWCEIYIIKPGEIYENFKEILISKAREGVEVRLIVDDFGRWAMPWYTILELKKEGIQIAIYGRTHFPFIGAENGYRLHRKFFVIDNEMVIGGGINLSDEYAHYSKKYGYWMDLNFSIKGAVVHDFSMLFLGDWVRITKTRLTFPEFQTTKKITTNALSFLVESGPDNIFSHTGNALITSIHSATSRIWITTPYLTPSKELLNALRIASLKGIDVRIFLPGMPDKKSIYSSTMYFASFLALDYGIKFYRMNSIFLHSKLTLFDNIASVGTTNLDFRSFSSQFEYLVFLTGKACENVEKIFCEYKRLSRLIDFAEHAKHKRYRLIKQGIISLFLPLM